MSYLNTRNALVQKLVDSGIKPFNEISVENDSFDPNDLDSFFACYFIPATTEMLGKDSLSVDQQRGIFQVSVYVKLNSGQYDLLQMNLIDQIISEFSYNSKAVYNTQTVDILESTVNNGTEESAWFKRDISINYLTFSTR